MRPLRRSDVVIGTPVPWPIHDRTGMLLLQRGGIIETADQLDTLLDRECLIADGGRSAEESTEPITFEPVPPFEAMLQLQASAEALHWRLISGKESAIHDKIDQQIAVITDALAKDADAALASMQLQLDSRARQSHAAIICAFAAHKLQLDADITRSLISAALTYDVGLTPISAQLNAQSEQLTAEQRAEIEQHPMKSVQLLEAAGVTDPVWLDAVRHHHERLDGSGYPDHRSGEQIQLPARLLAIADIYTAMLRPRSYRSALPARMALRGIFMERGKLIDSALAETLVKELGVFPPGTLVRLANMEVGIVLRRGGDATHPQVCRLMTAEGYRASVTLLRDTNAAQFRIVDSVSHDHYPGLLVNIARLWN